MNTLSYSLPASGTPSILEGELASHSASNFDTPLDSMPMLRKPGDDSPSKIEGVPWKGRGRMKLTHRQPEANSQTARS